MDGYGSMGDLILIFFKKSTKRFGVTCFIIYAEAQFIDHVNAVAILTVASPLQMPLAGTIPNPSNICAWFSQVVSGVNPTSSIASEYRKGLIEEPTWRFVFILA